MFLSGLTITPTELLLHLNPGVFAITIPISLEAAGERASVSVFGGNGWNEQRLP